MKKLSYPASGSDHFRFGFYQKKVIKPVFFKKTKTGSNQLVSIRFGYFRTKTGFFSLAQFFSVWLGFFSIWVRFFRFQAYKNKTEPVSFFKNLISLIKFFLYNSVFFSQLN